MAVNIRVVGVKEAIKYLNSKKRKINRSVSDSMKKAEDILLNETKSSIGGKKAEPKSVHTGSFLLSVKGSSTKNTASVTSDLNYAKYLEHGTTKIKARKHFFNSAMRKKKQIQKIINSGVKSAV